MDSSYRVASAHNRNRATIGSHCLGNLDGPFGERRNLKDSHRAIPDNGPGLGNLLGEVRDGLGAKIKPHLACRNAGLVFHYLVAGRTIHLLENYMIYLKAQPYILVVNFLR